jgi:hypothetical protein
MTAEIKKQASIFATASGVLLAYLWKVQNGDHLAQALCNLGDFVLHSLEFSLDWNRSRSEYSTESPRQYELYVEKVVQDPWFTSLWTLQEMIKSVRSFDLR